jgi:hypothetical protein
MIEDQATRRFLLARQHLDIDDGIGGRAGFFAARRWRKRGKRERRRDECATGCRREGLIAFSAGRKIAPIQLQRASQINREYPLAGREPS